MRTIKVSFPEAALEALDREASQRNMNRAELIRDKVSRAGAAVSKSLQPKDYTAIVSKAQKRMGGSMSRAHIEQVVAITFSCLAER